MLMSFDATAVVILSKYPTPGRVKTRLTPALSPEQAAAVHRIFLLHVVRRFRAMGPAELIVCFDPPDARAAMSHLLSSVAADVTLIPQVGGDLGHRLAAVAVDVGRRHRRMLIGAVDSPDVPSAHLRGVVDTMAGADVTLGLADDGGYWCIGLSNSVDAPALLRSGIEWSTDRTGTQTLAAARAMNYRTAADYSWGDVDRPEDLRNLVGRLERSGEPEDETLLADLRRALPIGF